MHKKILIYASILLCNYSANACDICGCAAGGSLSSILPQIQKNYVGIRYSYQKFNTYHNNKNSNEKINTTEIWGQYFIHTKIQVGIVLPYNHKQQKTGNETIINNGVSDIALLANYKLVSKIEDCNTFKHLLLVGSGIKLPTGNHKQKRNGELINSGLQNGSGSFDYLVKINYTLRYKNWGSNTDLIYRYNGLNTNNFSFGNRITANSKIFFWKKMKKNCHVLPYSSVLIDRMDKDSQNQIFVKESGGTIIANTIGLECYLPRLMFSVIYINPINQNLNLGLTKAAPSFQINLAFNF